MYINKFAKEIDFLTSLDCCKNFMKDCVAPKLCLTRN